ncbi:TPA: class I SAM-dependent DNA methyltransferase [Proteus mirabilis]|uniref:class I SAM-dependent DNA methyltransferase n=1 Tax=Proteus mirabilis TaxID=584 RepID=UPI00191B6B3A|nr:class I SAM-dependent DNA methyltransferase [Proteus mirabilis]EKW0401681.1 class I SAM-dependent DNA methyltransferase [Proteus mirabilis]EKW4513534.1 class I SAM-dependent DNA methyltransferase [Proteus mirabilis]QQT50534.1 class I SAM-dependent DNA methyltransferase [Proteus mirabilis]HEK2750204.1 class I SAM-dependent DNA methyltransferase [Proteus mirabilis]
MNSVQIEENVKSLVKQVSSQEISKDDFIYELLLAYGHRKSVVSRVKSGERNLAKSAGEVILKRHLYFKPCTSNLFAEIDALKNSKTVATNKIRFVVVTDFSQFIAIDTKTQDTLDIELGQLAKHFDFFLPWAGMEKMVYRGENPADVKAAEKMADFFDHIKATNYPMNATQEQLHEMVVFLNRLLFCFFAEDTKIFSENQFTNLLNQHTQEDGSDLVGVFERLFDVLNTPAHQRNDLPKYLNDFPYVNGGLFKKQIKVPTFDAKARRMLLDSGSLDWSDINPDIFGSMIQGVADPETRSKMGMHYTSVSNIMKVIEPLFLNDLYEEFDKCNDNINKLKKLQVRLSRIKFFDPACGSGNFLIITYKEIRELEIEILKRIRELEGESDSGMMGLFDESHSAIHLDQFYGIELDDFAHEMAILSLWLVEHQMNMVFETEFGYTAPTLPLKQSGRIVAGNAAKVDWELACPATHSDEVYILGNPPYLGSRKQNSSQKQDLKSVFDKEYKSLDYISIWFKKASDFISDKNSKAAFVSTNSVCQGEQVSLLWPSVLMNNVVIDFAYEEFKWRNSAKNIATVTVVIVGISPASIANQKTIFKEGLSYTCKNITPYITDGDVCYVSNRKKQISNYPEMNFGNMPADSGKLILSKEDKDDILFKYPNVRPYVKRLISAKEFLNNKERYCLWFKGLEPNSKIIQDAKDIRERIDDLKVIREASSRPKLANIPHLFAQITQPEGKDFILIPRHSSENREYIPMGYFDNSNIAHDSCLIIADAPIHLFSLLTSKLHMVWVKNIGGKLETRYRYSKETIYNNFPIPFISNDNVELLINSGLNILSEREKHPEKSLSELYDPCKMPDELRAAHNENDKLVCKCYGINAEDMQDETKILDSLLKLYVAKEK